MIYIAHRGNTHGPNPKENQPQYLKMAIQSGFHIETDLWAIDDLLYLGHDAPQYPIQPEFIDEIAPHLYCHCKNIDALRYILINHPHVECFFHDNDACVLTSKNKIWTYPGNKLSQLSICVMPEHVNQKVIPQCYGVCSDFVASWKNKESSRE